MNIDFKYHEYLLFKKISYIKIFNSSLCEKYNFKDLPYAVIEKPFPRKSNLLIEKDLVEYRFHGRGVTLIWDGVEIFCDFDTGGTRHNIIISPWGWFTFFSTYFLQKKNEVTEATTFKKETNLSLQKFESLGILLTKYPKQLTGLHVNEAWYTAYSKGLQFTFDNMDDRDML